MYSVCLCWEFLRLSLEKILVCSFLSFFFSYLCFILISRQYCIDIKVRMYKMSWEVFCPLLLILCLAEFSMKPLGPGEFFLITNFTYLMVLEPFRLSVSSWLSFGGLWFLRNWSISSELLNL